MAEKTIGHFHFEWDWRFFSITPFIGFDFACGTFDVEWLFGAFSFCFLSDKKILERGPF